MNVASKEDPRLQIPLSWADNINTALDYKLRFPEQKPAQTRPLGIHYPCERIITCSKDNLQEKEMEFFFSKGEKNTTTLPQGMIHLLEQSGESEPWGPKAALEFSIWPSGLSSHHSPGHKSHLPCFTAP